MSGLFPSTTSHYGDYEGGLSQNSQERPEDGSRWYFSRKEIEENSPSKGDGIDLKKETYLRKSYCTFLQDLGMRLKVPQVTIATAIIFCHRFFLRQSHAKNDRRTIATVCMFLAGKVEETPRPLKDVILVSYEIIHKKDADAVQKIKQKEVYEQQKELIVTGERVVLATLGFDLNVHHPYKPLVEAIKKFKVAQNALAQVAWNFVNDGLRTSLCLQFKPHHIAAGAIFLAAKFLKVKLPSDGEKVWWQEFDVNPRQLEEVSNQMLELYEQNRVPPSSEVDGSTEAGTAPRAPTKAPTSSEEHVKTTSHLEAGGGTNPRHGTVKASSSRPMSENSYVDHHGGPPWPTQGQSDENGSIEMKSSLNHKSDGEYTETSPHQDNTSNAQNPSKHRGGEHSEQGQESKNDISDRREVLETRDRQINRNTESREGTLGWSPRDVIKKIDREKVKAKLEKRRKSLEGISQKTELMDEDDLIERELEAGVELAAESEKNKRERRHSWSNNNKPSYRLQPENENLHQEKLQNNNMEEGELFATHDTDLGGYQSPKSINGKRKPRSPPSDNKWTDGKQWHHDNDGGSHHHNKRSSSFDYNTKDGQLDHSERDHKRQVQENRV